MSRINLLLLLGFAMAFDCSLGHAKDASSAFIIGADISWVQEQEANGIRWSDEGAEKDILAILKDHGFSWVRLRIFVNPSAEGGYSKEGFCDLAHTLEMARRIKAAGMGFLLDFHYSDTWADPGHQRKPQTWANRHGSDLEKAVYDHTRDVVEELKKQETLPDIVQIGNEISNGMLWPDGKVQPCSMSRGERNPRSMYTRRWLKTIRGRNVSLLFFMTCSRRLNGKVNSK
jgi:arabinogalactan endo-1,4-beta-galactosidase